MFQPSFSLQIDFLLILCWFLFQSGSCSSLFLNYWEGLLLLISESSLSPLLLQTPRSHWPVHLHPLNPYSASASITNHFLPSVEHPATASLHSYISYHQLPMMWAQAWEPDPHPLTSCHCQAKCQTLHKLFLANPYYLQQTLFKQGI